MSHNPTRIEVAEGSSIILQPINMQLRASQQRCAAGSAARQNAVLPTLGRCISGRPAAVSSSVGRRQRSATSAAQSRWEPPGAQPPDHRNASCTGNLWPAPSRPNRSAAVSVKAILERSTVDYVDTSRASTSSVLGELLGGSAEANPAPIGRW